MARGTGDVIQEYVVKLGTQIDNEGVNRILSFLDSSKLKALGVAGAIAGVTAAIFKLVESTTKREFELEKLAKQQSKTVALVRAENSALRAMGKTIEEINRDEHLKKIYEDVVKFNKELAFPTISDALRQVEGLETGFYKLKSAIGSAVQWIGAQVLVNLEDPINRITGKLEKGSTWLRDNMGRVTSKISLFISDFAKGIIGIGEGIGKVLDYVNSLPDAIKSVGVAIAGVFAWFKGGTIGKILMVITAIGDFMHDYDNWKYNKDNNLQFGDEGYVRTAFGDIWEIVDDESLTGEEKGGKIASTILKKLTKTLNEAFKDFKMSDIFGDSGDNNGGLIGAITRWFNEESNVDLLTDLGESVYNFIVRAVGVFGGTAGGIAGKILDAIFGSGTTSEDIYKDDDGSKGAALTAGIYGYVSGVIDHIKKKGFGPGALGAGVGQSLLDSLLVSVFENSKNENGVVTIDWDAVLGDLSSVGETFFNVIAKAMEGFTNAGSIIFTAVGNAIRNSLGSEGSLSGITGEGHNAFDDLADAIGLLGEEGSMLGDAISAGVAGWFASGSVVGGIVTGLGQLLSDISENPEEKIPEVVSQMEAFGEKLIGFLFGGVSEDGTEYGGIFETIITIVSNLWEKIRPYLQPLYDGLKAWFTNLFDLILNKIAAGFQALWPKIYNGLPQAVKDALVNFGVTDPNRSFVTQDDEGKWWIESTLGPKYAISEEDAKVLSGIAPYITGSVDEKGETHWRWAGDYMTKGDNEVRLVSASGKTIENYDANHLLDLYMRGLMEGKLWGISTTNNDGTKDFLGIDRDFFQTFLFGNMVQKQAGYGNWVDLANILSLGILKATGYDQYFPSVEGMINPEDFWDAFNSSGNFPDASTGGTSGGGGGGSPGGAGSLLSRGISNMVYRMGSSIKGALANDLGLGTGEGKGNAFLGGLRGSTLNISAPVNIYVTATGTDAKEIGQAAYDAAERHLTKTLKGVYN